MDSDEPSAEIIPFPLRERIAKTARDIPRSVSLDIAMCLVSGIFILLPVYFIIKDPWNVLVELSPLLAFSAACGARAWFSISNRRRKLIAKSRPRYKESGK
jgi:hypothetical protein